MDNKIQFAEVVKPDRGAITIEETIILEKEEYTTTTTSTGATKKKTVDLVSMLEETDEAKITHIICM
jgi:hypothetical protein